MMAIQGGFERAEDGSLVVTKDKEGATISNGFLRSPEYELVVSEDEGTRLNNGFLRDDDYALVITKEGERLDGGFLRDADYTLVVSESEDEGALHGGFLRGEDYSLRVSGLEETESGLILLHEDPMASSDYGSIWGDYTERSAASPERFEFIEDGDGDKWPKGDGTVQTEPGYRRLQILSGDKTSEESERTELGNNNRQHGIEGGEGTFMLYEEGKRYKTFFSVRLAANYPYGAETWQIAMQMKQCQPYVEDDLGFVVLEMSCNYGQYWLQYANAIKREGESWGWGAVTPGRWIRFCYDVTYSVDPAKGKIEVTVDDREAATDFVPQRTSGLITDTQTLAAAAKEGYGLAVGDPIPSHLRMGIYRNPEINVDTHVDIANVQVYEVKE
jgi:hypothetical protein